jgi:dihydrofolate reductase
VLELAAAVHPAHWLPGLPSRYVAEHLAAVRSPTATMSIRPGAVRTGGETGRVPATPGGTAMRRIIVVNNLTLDGVMQAPGRPDEDTRGGFGHGGWAVPHADPDVGRLMGQRMARTGALLLGRRTYEDFYGYWPHQQDDPFAEVLDNTRKYVASTRLGEPLPWRNSTLLQGDVAEAVARLRERPGKDIVVLGSGELIQALMRHDLIDEYVLLTHPLVLGSGRRMFPDGCPFASLRLVGSVTTSTGVVITEHRAAGRDDVP